MKRIPLLGLTVFAALAAGCSAGAGDPPPPESGVSASTKAPLEVTQAVDGMRDDIGGMLVASVTCRGDDAHDPACIDAAVAQFKAHAHPSGDITTKDFGALPSILDIVAKYLARIGQKQLCGVVQAWKGFNDFYYNRGGSATLGAGGVVNAGAELVYDLGDRQMAMFTYSGGGLGNILGGSVAYYEGFAASSDKHGLFDAWSGQSFALNGSVGIPEVDLLGVTGGVTFNGDQSVVGATMGFSIGFNAINVFGVDGAVMQNTYTPWNRATRGGFSPYGATLMQDGGHYYWQFGSGVSLALEIARLELEIVNNAGPDSSSKSIAWGMSGPSWSAALLAIASQRIAAAKQSIEGWCDGYAVVPSSCGENTASLHATSCAGGDMGGEDALFPPPPTFEDAIAPPPSCVLAGPGACADAFPGEQRICSANGSGGFACCKTFTPTTSCFSDADCKADESCARATDDPAATKIYGCVAKANHTCGDLQGP